MKKNVNDTYTKAVYQLLARVNQGQIDSKEDFVAEAKKLGDWLANGRFYYTQSYLYHMAEKCEEKGFDKEATAAGLLTLLHHQNESKLKKELFARGWRCV